MSSPAIDHDAVIAETVNWVEKAVIGLNLCPFAKAVHVNYDLHFRQGLYLFIISHHILREAMDDENLGRQMILGHETREILRRIIYICGIEGADHRTRPIPKLH